MLRILAKPLEVCLTIAFVASILLINAARLDDRETQIVKGPITEMYDVHLLVTRHGLSCTNIVEKWISWYDWGRKNMFDPLLGGIGQFGSHESGNKVAKWLEEKNYTLDAVLSSDLQRSIETALRMFPRGPAPLYVVPYIREHASGPSNSPKSSNNQLHDLTRAVKHNFLISYEWTNIFGHEKAEWLDFLTFLEHSFLPTLIKKHRKPPGSRIVLAVATHSMFMKKALDSECGHFWKMKDAEKPLNNQVLHVSYDFSIVRPSIHSMDGTPLHSLKPSRNPCEEAASGMSLKNAQGSHPKPLCLSDIGAECLDPIKEHSLKANTLWGKTAEHEMIKLANAFVDARADLDTLVMEIDDLFKFANNLRNFDPSKCHVSNMKCVPSEFCAGALLWCTKKDIEEVDRQFEQKKNHISPLSNSTLMMLQKLSAMKGQKCWTGGTPDIHWYRNFLKPDLSQAVTEALEELK